MEQARFAEALEFLARYLPRTRLVAARSLQKDLKQKVFLKLESELPTGSFKVRGALYALHVNLQRQSIREVVASSTGNHGAAVAYAATELGVRARIFLPENCNPVKKSNIERLGAEIVEKGAIDLAGAFEAAADYARKSGAFFLNDADDPDLPAGPGTIACEILQSAPEVDSIYVPMGDTALIRGVAESARQISGKVRLSAYRANERLRMRFRGRRAKPCERKRATRLQMGWRRGLLCPLTLRQFAAWLMTWF
jgi:threonine dehydratase